jgi:hypothetical protein
MGKGEVERREETISNFHQTQQLHVKINTNNVNKIHYPHYRGECSIITVKTHFH